MLWLADIYRRPVHFEGMDEGVEVGVRWQEGNGSRRGKGNCDPVIEKVN